MTAVSVTRRAGLCRCGHRTVIRGRPIADCPWCGRDAQAIAHHTGAADARNGRPGRVDIADISPIGQAYTRGYDAPDAWMYQ